ncbi:MAG TPA: MmgE/PrpD family protein [Cyclobacteriaceae bacterium]
MEKEYQNIQIARFANRVQYEHIGHSNVEQLKKHLLDSLGSLAYSVTNESVHKLMLQIRNLGEGGECQVPVLGKIAFDRAAQLFTALIRYPDFMDNFLGKEATCHPSDNIGSLLAASQLTSTSGKDFITAMALSYQLQCRLALEIPVMKEGIDHTLLLSYSIVAGVSRILQLSEKQLAHALGIVGCSMSPMVTSRAAYTYEWKGFASSMDAMAAIQAVALSQQGMTGPVQLFEGPKGFEDIFGMKLDYDWSLERFDLIRKCILKSYNAEVHTQPAVEAALEIRRDHKISPADIDRVIVTTFLTAFHITGSGAYGDRRDVETKEQADHSLFYIVAVALLDGELYPEQFTNERIRRDDVQQLLRKVEVHTSFPLHKPVAVAAMLDVNTLAYPDKVIANVEVILTDGQKFTANKIDFAGFHTRPLSWDDVIKKFKRLSAGYLSPDEQTEMIDVVQNFESYDAATLIRCLTKDGHTNKSEFVLHNQSR